MTDLFSLISPGTRRRFVYGSSMSFQSRMYLPFTIDFYLVLLILAVCHSEFASPYSRMASPLTFSGCLSKNSFDEGKCKSQIDALYSCCNSFYEKYGDDARTVSCPKANLLRLKIKQRSDQNGGNQRWMPASSKQWWYILLTGNNDSYMYITLPHSWAVHQSCRQVFRVPQKGIVRQCWRSGARKIKHWWLLLLRRFNPRL